MEIDKRPNKFYSHLYKSFHATRGDILSVIGLALGVITFFVVPDQAVLPLRYIIVPALIGVFLIFWFFHAAWTGFNLKEVEIPIVKFATDPPKAFSQAKVLLLLEPSILYSSDSIVSIYFEENDFERLIGVGRVINVQENKKIQVLVTNDVDFGDEWNSILNNDVNKLSKLRIKPTIPSFVMEIYRNE